MKEETMYSTQQAATAMGVSRATIHRWIDEGRLKAIAKTSPALKRKASHFDIPASAIRELMGEDFDIEATLREHADD